MSKPTESTEPAGVTVDALAAVFTEWDRRYREDPEGYESDVARLLRGQEPEEYGDGAAAYFVELAAELNADLVLVDAEVEA